jgi:choline dehydrogenase
MLGGIHRRFFLKLLGAAGLVATTETATGCATPEDDDAESSEDAINLEGFEYVIVGSGAGGAPLASNLARNGHKVLLLEAGEDRGETDMEAVPAFHLKSTEDETMRWDYYVKHYEDEARQAKDSKMTWDTPDGKLFVGTKPPAGSKPKGILYPRAGTLGGCTSHNAMVTVYPHESDWQQIAELTGDATWSATNMRRYFQVLERAEYLRTGDDATGHGTKGWLGVSTADAKLALRDFKILAIVQAAAKTVSDRLFGVDELVSIMRADLNAAGKARDMKEGAFQVPMAISDGRRSGPRDLLLDTVKKGFPLTIKTNSLATRVIFDENPGPDGKPKAIGIEFIEGKSLYGADPRAKAGTAPIVSSKKKKVIVSREVILAAGAYNTPQLLKLSGIGPKDELAKFRIPLQVDLPGVGTNLQDRYEVGVISEVEDDFNIINGCTFGKGKDPCLDTWRTAQGQFATARERNQPKDKISAGPYGTNGIAVGIIKKSTVSQGDPDLIVFGAPGKFRGYFPGYSEKATADKRHFTWAILKAHTGNRAGSVLLRGSADDPNRSDPRDVPEIDFKYFDAGTTTGGAADRDLQAVVEGVELARRIGKATGDLMLDDLPFGLGGVYEERIPGPSVQGAALKEFVKNEAWGHHASCTCPIGADGDPNAVLDSKFRVRGVSGLRVVDASVFPKIPGFFIVVPIYMVSEKATDVLLEAIGEKRKA